MWSHSQPACPQPQAPEACLMHRQQGAHSSCAVPSGAAPPTSCCAGGASCAGLGGVSATVPTGEVPLQAHPCARLFVCGFPADSVRWHLHSHVGQEVAAAAFVSPSLGACLSICSPASFSRQAQPGSPSCKLVSAAQLHQGPAPVRCWQLPAVSIVTCKQSPGFAVVMCTVEDSSGKYQQARLGIPASE